MSLLQSHGILMYADNVVTVDPSTYNSLAGGIIVENSNIAIQDAGADIIV